MISAIAAGVLSSLILASCAPQASTNTSSSTRNTQAQNDDMSDDANLSSEDNKEESIDSEAHLGAFEITAIQRELAQQNEAGYEVLDAGRGNPNWINTQSRKAYARFMEYAISESELTLNKGIMAGQAQLDGIGKRFDEAMDKNDEIDAFLIKAIDYCTKTLLLNKDSVIREFVDGIIGDYYPAPSRSLENTEVILNAYLQSTLYDGEKLADKTKVFPTEGGSAAIVYIFNALNHNKLLNKGDNIAIAAPIFTPYLQIPNVNQYSLTSVELMSNKEDGWDISDEELEKLKDPKIKAFFLVNPSNPASHALSKNTLEKLKDVVKANPNLIILTDDVYGTFVNDFKTIYSVVPQNTILVYSFSKLYGVTGWRIGLVAMHDDNVVDKLLSELPEKDKEFLESEYSIVVNDVKKLKFIDRIVADSRTMALYHTSGLSTPQQIFMDFLALTHLVNESDDPYIEMANEVVAERYTTLMNTLGLKTDDSIENARYYALIDMIDLARARYGDDFAGWYDENVDDLDFLNDLATKQGVVLMYGPGFDGSKESVRVSLANLDKEAYAEIGRRVLDLLEVYYKDYSNNQ